MFCFELVKVFLYLSWQVQIGKKLEWLKVFAMIYIIGIKDCLFIAERYCISMTVDGINP